MKKAAKTEFLDDDTEAMVMDTESDEATRALLIVGSTIALLAVGAAISAALRSKCRSDSAY